MTGRERAPDHSQQTVLQAWAPTPPDWVLVLAAECDAAGSQNRVAERIGRSASAVSYVLKNRYPGDMAKFEATVRAQLMDERVDCPGLGGEIRRTECLEWQGKDFAATNPVRVRMFRACRGGCPHSNLERKA